MKTFLIVAVLVAAALAKEQCFPSMFQVRAEVYVHPGMFYDVGLWVDFPGMRQLTILNPVPGFANVTALLTENGVTYQITGIPDDNNGYNATSCVTVQGGLMDRCQNLSEWYGATVGGYNGLGGFKTNTYTAGMMFNQSYTQSFMYAHGVSTLPTWYRSFNATNMAFEEWNLYDMGNLVNATAMFRIPALCNNAAKAAVPHVMVSSVRNFFRQ